MKKTILKKLIALTLLVTISVTLISCEQISIRKFDVNALKKTSNLITLECHFKNVAVYTKQGFFGPERQLLEYTATINVGIDMKAISYDKTTNTITIPKPKVISKNYDADNVKTITADYLVFSNLKVEEAQDEMSKTLDELATKVEENASIMNRAQNLAATQLDLRIKNMFDTSTKFNYSFE